MKGFSNLGCLALPRFEGVSQFHFPSHCIMQQFSRTGAFGEAVRHHVSCVNPAETGYDPFVQEFSEVLHVAQK